MPLEPDKAALLELAHYKMPLGKYKGRYLVDLPLPYLMWFKRKGFPNGKLGNYLATMLSLKSEGLEALIRRLQSEFPR